MLPMFFLQPVVLQMTCGLSYALLRIPNIQSLAKEVPTE